MRALPLGTVALDDGWQLQVYRGGSEEPPPLAQAKELVEEHYYERCYRHIAPYLRREDVAMIESRKVHFVLEDHQGVLQGHQLLYGDGPSPVPCEVLHSDVDQRGGSRLALEVKRAVLLARGRYPDLLAGIAAWLVAEHGAVEELPADHLILGYSIEPAVARYLIGLGFRERLTRGVESFIYFPSRELVARYGTRAWKPARSAFARIDAVTDRPSELGSR